MPDKIKILDFSPYYPPRIGGLEKYAEELHEKLSERGCYITVFAPRIPKDALEQETKPGIAIIRYPAFEIIFNYPLPCLWKIRFWQQWKLISEKNYDLVISTTRFFVQPLLAFFYAKKRKLPILHIEHGSDFVKGTPLVSLIAKLFDKTIGRFILCSANKIIAPSQSAARFIKLLSNREAPVIYRGMPFSEIDAIPPQEKTRERFKNKKIVTFIGRLINGKGVIHLLEAVRNLKNSDIVLLIAGYGCERKNLEAYSKNHGLAHQAYFLGKVPFSEAISILKITDIFVNPSYNEGLPTSVLEAGVCKIAIIATNVGGTPEIIKNDISGIIIEPHNTKVLEEALKELLEDSEKRKTLGENARREIEQKFNWEKSTTAYLKEIDMLLKK